MTKKCSCGKIHTKVPDNARPDIQDDVLIAYCWECDHCGSTIYKYKFSMEVVRGLILRGIL